MTGKMLKILAALACLTLGVGLAACGGKGDEGSSSSSEVSSSMEESSSEIVDSSSEGILDGNSEDECPEEDYYTEGLVFMLQDDDTYAVTDYTGTATEVVIPSVYNGKEVTSIGNSAFIECDSLTEILIPDSVKSIDEYAFRYCSKLTRVAFGENSQLTSIGDYAFHDCYNLTSVVIPDSVMSIGIKVFKDCHRLTEIVIPDNLISAGSAVFVGCDNLQYIVKDGLKYLGNKENPYVYLADTETTEMKLATIENGCKIIGASAFYGCEKLTEIVIPDSVTSIGDFAFYYCLSLKYNEKNGLNYLGNGNNEYLCLISVDGTLKKQLTSISIENSCKVIGSNALDYCSSAKEIIIPDSVIHIDRYAFYGCSSLTEITFNGTVEQWNNVTKHSDWCYMVSVTKVVCTDDEVML